MLERAPLDPKANRAAALLRLRQGRDADAAVHLARCSAPELRTLGGLLARRPPASGAELGDAFRAAAGALGDESPGERGRLLGRAREQYERHLADGADGDQAARLRLLVRELPGPDAVPSQAPRGGPAGPPAGGRTLFDENRDLIETLAAKAGGGAAIEPDTGQPGAGTVSLRVTGDGWMAAVPGWDFPVAERPGPGEVRYLRLMVRNAGGAGQAVKLELAGAGSFEPRRRLYWGPGSLPESRRGGDALPDRWTTVTIDLFREFGAFRLTGFGVQGFAGKAVSLDAVRLAAGVEEFDRPAAASARAEGRR